MGGDTQPPSRASEHFDSTQPTAVNTPRAPSMSEPTNNTWKELRDVVSAAQPGVKIKLGVYVFAPLHEDRSAGLNDQENKRWTSEAIERDGGRITVVKSEQQHAETEQDQQSEPRETATVPLTWRQWLGRELHAAFIQPILRTFDIVITAAYVALCIAAFCIVIVFAIIMIQLISSALEYLFPMNTKPSFAARDAPVSPLAAPHTASKSCAPLSALQRLSRVGMVLASLSAIALWL